MELSDAQLQEFRDRCLTAKVYGYQIANADLYMVALAQEVGQEVVPEDVSKGSAAHLFGLAEEALEGRSGGHKKKGKKAKAHVVEHKAEKTEVKKTEIKKIEPVEHKKAETEKIEAKTETKIESVEHKTAEAEAKTETKSESKHADEDDEKAKKHSK